MTVSVLVVDDDAWVTRALSAVLRAASDIEVVGVVHSGSEAISTYASTRPDVVLMDVNMSPGMSGIEATIAIRREDPDARIVILTTIAPGPGLARAIDAGATAAVNKNASDETLLRVIRAAAGDEDPRLLKHLAADLQVSGVDGGGLLDPSPSLTAAEQETLLLICDGLSYQEIAERRHVAVSTVTTHARELRHKLNAQSLAGLVVRALQLRYIG